MMSVLRAVYARSRPPMMQPHGERRVLQIMPLHLDITQHRGAQVLGEANELGGSAVQDTEAGQDDRLARRVDAVENRTESVASGSGLSKDGMAKG